MDLYSQVIHKSRYARYLPEKGRRENWEETVDRLVDYLHTIVDRMDIPEEEKQIIKRELG